MGYYEEARRRAQRRRSPWDLLLIPAVVLPAGSLWWGAVKSLEALHAVLYPGQNLRTASNAVGAISRRRRRSLQRFPSPWSLGMVSCGWSHQLIDYWLERRSLILVRDFPNLSDSWFSPQSTWFRRAWLVASLARSCRGEA